ncbi:hypothetical protein PFISCL1PPCAC_27497, partial [Pristionchus fissidentatus]
TYYGLQLIPERNKYISSTLARDVFSSNVLPLHLLISHAKFISAIHVKLCSIMNNAHLHPLHTPMATLINIYQNHIPSPPNLLSYDGKSDLASHLETVNLLKLPISKINPVQIPQRSESDNSDVEFDDREFVMEYLAIRMPANKSNAMEVFLPDDTITRCMYHLFDIYQSREDELCPAFFQFISVYKKRTKCYGAIFIHRSTDFASLMVVLRKLTFMYQNAKQPRETCSLTVEFSGMIVQQHVYAIKTRNSMSHQPSTPTQTKSTIHRAPKGNRRSIRILPLPNSPSTSLGRPIPLVDLTVDSASYLPIPLHSISADPNMYLPNPFDSDWTDSNNMHVDEDIDNVYNMLHVDEDISDTAYRYNVYPIDQLLTPSPSIASSNSPVFSFSPGFSSSRPSSPIVEPIRNELDAEIGIPPDEFFFDATDEKDTELLDHIGQFMADFFNGDEDDLEEDCEDLSPMVPVEESLPQSANQLNAESSVPVLDVNEVPVEEAVIRLEVPLESQGVQFDGVAVVVSPKLPSPNPSIVSPSSRSAPLDGNRRRSSRQTTQFSSRATDLLEMQRRSACSSPEDSRQERIESMMEMEEEKKEQIMKKRREKDDESKKKTSRRIDSLTNDSSPRRSIRKSQMSCRLKSPVVAQRKRKTKNGEKNRDEKRSKMEESVERPLLTLSLPATTDTERFYEEWFTANPYNDGAMSYAFTSAVNYGAADEVLHEIEVQGPL